MTGSQIRAAEEAHTRLMMDADCEHLLARTTFEALRNIARRHHTENVPQVRAALTRLKGSGDGR